MGCVQKGPGHLLLKGPPMGRQRWLHVGDVRSRISGSSPNVVIGSRTQVVHTTHSKSEKHGPYGMMCSQIIAKRAGSGRQESQGGGGPELTIPGKAVQEKGDML